MNEEQIANLTTAIEKKQAVLNDMKQMLCDYTNCTSATSKKYLAAAIANMAKRELDTVSSDSCEK